jgi:ABC-type transport system involved in multi-copper enzyme maturation permease subunit
MITPILLREARQAGGNPAVLAWRWVSGAMLFVCVWPLLGGEPGLDSRSAALARYTDTLLQDLVFVAVFLAAGLVPLVTAPAITEEKNSGNLQLLLTTGLGAWDIVAGKLFGRLWSALLLLLPLLPVICFCAAVTGRGGGVLLVLLPLGPLFALGTAGLLASVWARTTPQALLAVYVAGVAAGAAVAWFGDALRYFDPLFVIGPALVGYEQTAFRRLGGSLLAWGVVGALCLGVAAWWLRPACRRQFAGPGMPKTLPWRPPVGDDPIFWKECYVEGAAPAAGPRRLPRGLAAAGIVLLSLLLLLGCLRLSWDLAARRSGTTSSFADRPVEIAACLHGLVIAVLGVVLVGVRSAAAIRSERERGTLDPLLVTGLRPGQLLRGKARGIFWAFFPYLLAALPPAVGGLALTVPGDEQAAVLFWPFFWVLVLRRRCASCAPPVCPPRS